MHATKILGAIIISLGCALVAVAATAPAPADKFEKFELKVHALEILLKAEADISKRYDQFLKTHKDLVALKNGPRGAETDELSMSLFLDALKDLPAKKKFSAKKCPEYIQKSKTMMTGSQGKEQDPWATRGIQMVEIVCKQ
ncbi:MAG: hypothetical protein ACXWQO_17250 [Bdellovibrionota bacterium]